MFVRLACLCAVPLFLCFGAFAAEMKIGYINSEEVFLKYKGTQDAQEEFDKAAASVQQKATNMKKEVEDMKEQLDKQSLLLSKERKKEMEDKLATKAAEFEKFVSQNYGKDGELLQKNEKMTKPIIDKINKVIEKIAIDEDYDFIIDARAGGLVYAKKKFDLTKQVIDVINKQP